MNTDIVEPLNTKVTRNRRPYKINIYVIKKIQYRSRHERLRTERKKIKGQRIKNQINRDCFYLSYPSTIHSQAGTSFYLFLYDQQIDRFHRHKNLIKFRAIFCSKYLFFESREKNKTKYFLIFNCEQSRTCYAFKTVAFRIEIPFFYFFFLHLQENSCNEIYFLLLFTKLC